jgi:hypothetical protein
MNDKYIISKKVKVLNKNLKDKLNNTSCISINYILDTSNKLNKIIDEYINIRKNRNV